MSNVDYISSLLCFGMAIITWAAEQYPPPVSRFDSYIAYAICFTTKNSFKYDDRALSNSLDDFCEQSVTYFGETRICRLGAARAQKRALFCLQ